MVFRTSYVQEHSDLCGPSYISLVTTTLAEEKPTATEKSPKQESSSVKIYIGTRVCDPSYFNKYIGLQDFLEVQMQNY